MCNYMIKFTMLKKNFLEHPVILYKSLNTAKQRPVPRTNCYEQIEKLQFVNQQL
jgi:hypothetical protein